MINEEFRAYHTNYAMTRVGLLEDPQQGYQVISPTGDFVNRWNSCKMANIEALRLNKENGIIPPNSYYGALLSKEGVYIREAWE